MRTARQIAAELASLFPPGWAWESMRRQTGNMWVMLQPVADAFTEIELSAEALLPQIDPGQATDLLADYERILGTDCCVGSTVDLPLAQRQAIAHARWTQPMLRSPADFVAYAATLGYEITITEFSPAFFGDAFGEPFGGDDWDHTWQVYVPQFDIEYDVFGGEFGDPFASWGKTVLQCQLLARKPVHTILIWAYGPDGNPAVADAFRADVNTAA
ncbi:putative phage tail protein [Gluconacetobacter sp.]|uniref:putative phage tail protein n=1 Tax=Gluconacetobacter sp. TaxID=1935994 RepID=UPI0039EAA14B